MSWVDRKRLPFWGVLSDTKTLMGFRWPKAKGSQLWTHTQGSVLFTADGTKAGRRRSWWHKWGVNAWDLVKDQVRGVPPTSPEALLQCPLPPQNGITHREGAWFHTVTELPRASGTCPALGQRRWPWSPCHPMQHWWALSDLRHYVCPSRSSSRQSKFSNQSHLPISGWEAAEAQWQLLHMLSVPSVHWAICCVPCNHCPCARSPFQIYMRQRVSGPCQSAHSSANPTCFRKPKHSSETFVLCPFVSGELKIPHSKHND
jgi:hypothetical protein